MKGKFKIKFNEKEDYLKGTADFMKLLNTWQENESKYKREYDLVPTVDDENKIYSLEVSIGVSKIN